MTHSVKTNTSNSFFKLSRIKNIKFHITVEIQSVRQTQLNGILRRGAFGYFNCKLFPCRITLAAFCGSGFLVTSKLVINW